MEEVNFLWDGWEPILRVLIVGSVSYLGLITLLRISGKRTLTRMTVFDFVIAITIGSAFGRILTARSVTISEAITAFFLLILLQLIFAFFEVRFKKFKHLTSHPPSLLYYNGEFIRKNMRGAMIREDELLSASRKQGVADLEEIEAIVFETDGSFSVIKKSAYPKRSTYKDLLSERESKAGTKPYKS